MLCYVWLILIIVVMPVHGMESLSQTVEAPSKELGGLAHFCRHSHHIGYNYNSELKTLRLVSTLLRKIIDDATEDRKEVLLQALNPSLNDLLDGPERVLVFNTLGNACGWKQYFCSKCLSPTRSNCTCDTSTITASPVALYRAQLGSDDNEQVVVKEQHHKHHIWKGVPRLEICATSLQSPFLEAIVERYNVLKKDDLFRPCWGPRFIPYRAQYWQSFYTLYVSLPRFEADDKLTVYETAYMSIWGSWSSKDDGRAPYSKIRSLSPCGEHALRDFLFTIGDQHSRPLTFMSHLPNFLNALQNTTEKRYEETTVTVDAADVLSKNFKLSSTDIEDLHHIIPDTLYEYVFDGMHNAISTCKMNNELLPKIRLAQIGGAAGPQSIIKRMVREYEQRPEKIFQLSKHNTVGISQFGALHGYDGYQNATKFRNSDSNYLATLLKRTRDEVYQYEQNATESNNFYLIYPPHHCASAVNVPGLYFTEARTLKNKLWQLNVWSRTGNERNGYTPNLEWKSIEYTLPKKTITPISHSIVCDHSHHLGRLIIIAGAVMYILRQKNISADDTAPVSLALLTDNECSAGYSIETISEVQADCTVRAYIKPVQWWENFRRPIKIINLKNMTVKSQWQYNFNPYSVVQYLYNLVMSVHKSI